MDKLGAVVYTSGFRIKTDRATDLKMEKAASAQVSADYDVTSASCITTCTDALKAGGLNVPINKGINDVEPVPNAAYEGIKSLNKGTDATKSITPTEATKAEMKANSAQGIKAAQDSEQARAEQEISSTPY